MIKSITFRNFRNLDCKTYEFTDKFNLIIGKNGSGKTNILDGIRLAFSAFDGNYFKVNTSDFTDSDDNNPIEIIVLLEDDAIPSFNQYKEDGVVLCGFRVTVNKTSRGVYRKSFYNYDGSPISSDIVMSDKKIPSVYFLPMRRIDDIYSEYASISLDQFIDSEQTYASLRNDFSESVANRLESEIGAFKLFSKKFGKDFDVELNGIKTSGEKIYVIEGSRAHNRSIGAGYRSIANIILNTTGGGYGIILLDELENHLHPALLRTLVQELKSKEDILIVATTHSPVAINQMKIKELIDSTSGNVADLIGKATIEGGADEIIKKIDIFLHPGRNELMLADKVIIVEGFSEELVLRNYIENNNMNVTVVNAQGVMFEPYLVLAKALGKHVIAISDNDRSQSEDGKKNTTRFSNLKVLCDKLTVPLLEMDNTFETDIHNEFGETLDSTLKEMLRPHNKHTDIIVSKSNKKTEFATRLVESSIDLSNWHIIRSIVDEFKDN